MELDQINSWYDVADSNLLSSEIQVWEKYMEDKELIDQIFTDIEQQITNYKDIGINYLDQLHIYEFSEDENIKKYIYERYFKCFELLSNVFSIPNYDDIIIFPDEVKKMFKLMYYHFYSIYIDELLYYLTMHDYEEQFKYANFKECKQIVISYYEKLIDSFLKISELLKHNLTNIDLSHKTEEYMKIKDIIQSTDEIVVSNFFKKMLESVR